MDCSSAAKRLINQERQVAVKNRHVSLWSNHRILCVRFGLYWRFVFHLIKDITKIFACEATAEESTSCTEKNKYFNDHIVRRINPHGHITIYEHKESGVGVFV